MTAPQAPFLWLPDQDGDPEVLTLLVDTPKGTHIRRTPPALPLPAPSTTGREPQRLQGLGSAGAGRPAAPGRHRGAVGQPLGMPANALVRRDWGFLFDQLRSTTAVLDHLFRAAGEPVRHYELAAADADAAPRGIDTELVGAGGTLCSAPQLQQAPAAVTAPTSTESCACSTKTAHAGSSSTPPLDRDSTAVCRHPRRARAARRAAYGARRSGRRLRARPVPFPEAGIAS